MVFSSAVTSEAPAALAEGAVVSPAEPLPPQAASTVERVSAVERMAAVLFSLFIFDDLISQS